MKPTLEEVKAYFKNAKEVKSIVTDKIHELKHPMKIDISDVYDSRRFWVYADNIEGVQICIVNYKGYAEIISYKEETFTFSKSFILDAHSSACSTWKDKIEKEFPVLFIKEEPQPTELTVPEIEAKLGYSIKIIK